MRFLIDPKEVFIKAILHIGRHISHASYSSSMILGLLVRNSDNSKIRVEKTLIHFTLLSYSLVPLAGWYELRDLIFTPSAL